MEALSNRCPNAKENYFHGGVFMRIWWIEAADRHHRLEEGDEREQFCSSQFCASKWQKTDLQLQIKPRIMNEEFSPEVLIEYFCRTHFVDNDGCFQRNKKKRGGKEGSCKIVINIPPLPAPGFSWARLLIGKWWLFIEQLNWMMFDTSRWGVMNGVCRGLGDLKASTYEAQGHINCEDSIFCSLPKMNRWILRFRHSTDPERNIPEIQRLTASLS